MPYRKTVPGMIAGLIAFGLTAGVATAQEGGASAEQPTQEEAQQKTVQEEGANAEMPKPEGAPPNEAKKRGAGRGPLGLPSIEALKEKVGFNEEQCKKAEELYESYKGKIGETKAKAKEGADRKAAREAFRTLRSEIAAKLMEICSDDEQKKKLEEASMRPGKKKPPP